MGKHNFVNPLLRLTRLGYQAKYRLSRWASARMNHDFKREEVTPAECNIQHEDFCRVYVLFSSNDRADLEILFKAKGKSLAFLLAGVPLFLDKKSAMDYARFMDENSVIVKLYTPESGIMSHAQSLTLRHRVISKVLVHGFYLYNGASFVYHQNPFFNETWLNRISSVSS